VQATGWDLGPREFGPREFGPREFGRVHLPHEQGTVHERVQAGPEFTELRQRLRGRVFSMAAAFLLWYLAYVLLASYARELMATPVSGGITVGLLVGLAQFASTFALTAAYVRFARRRIDPLAARIRGELERGGEAGSMRPTGRLLPAHPASPLRDGEG
jgi:uncharacterized membrane protein (DUF485 family)